MVRSEGIPKGSPNPVETAPRIGRAKVPFHLLGSSQCPGVGKTRSARLQSYAPKFSTAEILVHCSDCGMDLQTEVKYNRK